MANKNDKRHEAYQKYNPQCIIHKYKNSQSRHSKSCHPVQSCCLWRKKKFTRNMTRSLKENSMKKLSFGHLLRTYHYYKYSKMLFWGKYGISTTVEMEKRLRTCTKYFSLPKGKARTVFVSAVLQTGSKTVDRNFTGVMIIMNIMKL